MNTVKCEYIPAKGENKFLKVELYYSLGGANMFTYRNEARGYYVSVSPVERRKLEGCSGFVESYTAFTGLKALVYACGRRSKAAEAKAVQKYDSMKAELLKNFSSYLPDNTERE